MAPPPQTMSLEASLDEERLDVLARLSDLNPPRASLNGGRSTSPYTAPRSPIRNMLDVGDDEASSLRGAAAAKSPPRLGPIRSMLDIDSPPEKPVEKPQSSQSSPALDYSLPEPAPLNVHPRSFSDTMSSGPRPLGSSRSSHFSRDITSEYQFGGIITSHPGQALPKRNTQLGKRSAGNSIGSSNDFLRGSDTTLVDRGRQPANMSRSRGRSSLLLGPNMAQLDDGRVVNINNAYLALSGGSLGQSGSRRRSDDDSNNRRLTKDYLDDYGEFDQTSDEPDPISSEDEAQWSRRLLVEDERKRKSGKLPKSLLAAAEEERISLTARRPPHQYRSLLDPEITVTKPSGEKVSKSTKSEIHPATSYDQGSAGASGIDSDDAADVDDIVRAQKLSFSTTPIIETPEAHRAIRIIYRGEYAKIVKAAEEEHHRLRKYLVATDISDESTHALEWAIGTVLRDGDTLVAIYCVDEDTGIAAIDQVPDEVGAMKEQATALRDLTTTRTPPVSTTMLPPFSHLSRAQPLGATAANKSRDPSPVATSRERNRGEEERQRAVQDISDRVVKLLRKTRLQVRVLVEVLHCKNPKHMVTEVIDLVEPTLVILGSRGRSALKGVILGSFSNYLVTKSSVPVMVARKRLRKQSKYNKMRPQPQVNNLSNPTSRKLANAKVD